jgi:hypothetical protein
MALEQVCIRGARRYAQMTRMANAMQTVRNQYMMALHRAQSSGSGPGWGVQRLPFRDAAGLQVLDENGQPQRHDQIVFDTDAFTA